MKLISGWLENLLVRLFFRPSKPGDDLREMLGRGKVDVESNDELKRRLCSHPDVMVKVTGARPVTLQPVSGVCRKCGACVKAKTVWTRDKEREKYGSRL